MEFRRLGKTDMQVGVVGIGGAEIGFENAEDKTVDALLGVALDAGVNVIDTAIMYRDSEEKIGRALRHRRDRFYVFTKCGRCPPSRLSKFGIFTRLNDLAERVRNVQTEQETLSWQPKVLKWNIDQSLRRLKVDCIDLIQLHSCSEETLRRGDAIEVLSQARRAGKARYIGYSGDGEAAHWAIESGHFDAIQTSINIADQQAVDTTVPFAQKRRMGVIAKRPVANTLWSHLERPTTSQYYAYWDRLKLLNYDFLKGDRAFEIALRFTLAVPGVHTAIVGTTNPDHLRSNIQSIGSGVLPPLDRYEEIRFHWKNVDIPDRTTQL